MSKRFQIGSVKLVGKVWKGRYWQDVPGKEKRKHPQVDLGSKPEMSKREAQRKLMEIIGELGLNKSSYIERLEGRAKTFNRVADAWIEKRLPQLALSTQDSAPKLIAKYLRPSLGTLELEIIKTGTLNDWITGLVKIGLEPKTVHNLWKMFRAMMNWHAQQNDEAKRAWYPSLPFIPDVEQRWFTQDETRLIVASATGQFKPLFQLAGFSGLRSGEVSGLHVEDLDLGRGVIHAQRSIYKGVEVPIKGKRRRYVSIDSTTVRMLKEHLDGRTTGLAFKNQNGKPLDNNSIVGVVLKPICKRLGIALGGMHAFRHGRISHMQSSNVPADLIKRQVGHRTLRTTSIYTHFSPQFVRDTVERLSGSGSVN
jgi:integrase